MLRFLTNLLRGEPRTNARSTSAGESKTSKDSQMPVEHRGCWLLTRRVEDTREDLRGFRETYFCTHCGDYFLLAWQPKERPVPESVEPVLNHLVAGKDLDAMPVFCPQCGSVYAMYGLVLRPGEPAIGMSLLETFVTRYQLEDRLLRRNDELSTFRVAQVEKFVVLISGEFPDGVDRDEFVCSYLDHAIGPQLLARFGFGAIEVHVLRVEKISDDTEHVTMVLQEAVYQGEKFGCRLFTTTTPYPLKPPFSEIMLCLVESISGRPTYLSAKDP